MVYSLSERKHSDMESEPDDIQDLADPINDISEANDAQIISKNGENTEPTNDSSMTKFCKCWEKIRMLH